MIVAELKGKIPTNLDHKEDILTSNVFSFFKYSDRQLLKEYLCQLGLIISLADSENAEFYFWLSYADGTEPDLIVICGRYYLLFEAKLYSDFSLRTSTSDSQIEREIKMGSMAANNVNKEFVFIAITGEYYKNISKYSKYENMNILFIWTNWQALTNFIYNKLTENIIKRDKGFAMDLYSLLVKKRLRSFIGISNIKYRAIETFNETIFYSIKSSEFKGDFSGFLLSLCELKQIKPYQRNFSKSFFKTIPTYNYYSNEKVFYYGSETR